MKYEVWKHKVKKKALKSRSIKGFSLMEPLVPSYPISSTSDKISHSRGTLVCFDRKSPWPTIGSRNTLDINRLTKRRVKLVIGGHLRLLGP